MLISHRISTVREADMIVYLRGGAIIEQGTHDELLAQRGAYFELIPPPKLGTGSRNARCMRMGEPMIGDEHPEDEILGKAYDARLMARMLRYLRPYWKLLAVAFAFLMLQTGTQLLGPYITKIAIDRYIATGILTASI